MMATPATRWLLLLSASAILVVVRARRLRPVRLAEQQSSVLIIGGTGLMGVPTAAALLDAGHVVTVMSRGKSKGQGSGGNRPKLPAGCKVLTCDRTDETSFIEALCNPSCPRIVVDFTAMKPEHIEAVKAANVRRRIKHYVFVSTNMVYPGGVEDMDLSATAAQGQRVDEGVVRRDLASEAPDNYGGSKLKCEALLAAAAVASDGRAPLISTVVRPPAVVGAGCDSRHEKLRECFRIRTRASCCSILASVCSNLHSRRKVRRRPQAAATARSPPPAGCSPRRALPRRLRRGRGKRDRGSRRSDASRYSRPET